MSDCPSAETLVALWAGELGDEETAAVDEHVFGCDECAAETESLAKVIGTLRENLPFVISHAHRDRLVAAGQRVDVTSVDPTPDRAPQKSARFTPDVDLLVFALRGDVAEADRVDVKIASQSGDKEYLLEDVPFDRATGEVLICCQRHFEGMFTGDPVFSVQAIRAGKRRDVGDYVVAHVWR
jgi:hypothetical protein